MSPREARDIILSIFKNVWDPRLALYNDVPGNIPPSENIWARATIRHATGNQSSLAGEVGTRQFTAEGTVFIQIFTPIGSGSTEGYVAAAQVQNAFRVARNADVWFRDVRLNEVGIVGAFDQTNVLATFSYADVR